MTKVIGISGSLRQGSFNTALLRAATQLMPPDAELVVVPSFSGAAEQLWRIEQLPDGAWRIMPKSAATAKEPLALSAIGSSFATLSKFDPKSDKQRWQLKTP